MLKISSVTAAGVGVDCPGGREIPPLSEGLSLWFIKLKLKSDPHRGEARENTTAQQVNVVVVVVAVCGRHFCALLKGEDVIPRNLGQRHQAKRRRYFTPAATNYF